MFDLPLHPAVVHIPLGLAFIMPLLVLGFWIAIHKKWMPNKSWIVLIALQLVIFAAGFVSKETGEDDRDIAKEVVEREFIKEHSENADYFLILSGLSALALAGGLLPRRKFGTIFKAASLLLVSGNLYYAIALGESGGALVYKHGAASAHINASGGVVGTNNDANSFIAEDEHYPEDAPLDEEDPKSL